MLGIINAVFGPRLYRIHRCGTNQGMVYVMNTAESWSETVIKCLKFCWSAAYWTSPMLFTWLYRRDVFTPDGLVSSASYVIGIFIVYSFAIFVRGFGRYLNSDYMTFVRVLNDARKCYTRDSRKRLQQYDCDQWAWPFEFKATSHGPNNRVTGTTPTLNRFHPLNLLSYVVVHTFGRRMLYPGATALISTLMSPHLVQGRAKLVEENNGDRAKLKTADGNSIDTMFIDRRTTGTENGTNLVICSEGNSGFYEVGCVVTPLEAGYSVLGWNHPGFAQSTGAPLPNQEQDAIDAVMQYAINGLNFRPNRIILFAWSIGGYAATWAAMTYPDIKHIVLDATFDDVLPLARAKMPQSWATLVDVTIRNHLNLNNAEQLCRYPGPVLLIRRFRDEMITTVDASVLESNRGNDLLIALLQTRFPNLINTSTMPTLKAWLAADKQRRLVFWTGRHEGECTAIFDSYIQSLPESPSFPCLIGDDLPEETQIHLVLFLANKYMVDYDSTHCTPLPAAHFQPPWNPWKK